LTLDATAVKPLDETSSAPLDETSSALPTRLKSLPPPDVSFQLVRDGLEEELFVPSKDGLEELFVSSGSQADQGGAGVDDIGPSIEDEVDMTPIDEEARIRAQRTYDNFDIRDRFWKLHLARSVLRGDPSIPEKLNLFSSGPWASEEELSSESQAYLAEIEADEKQAEEASPFMPTPNASTNAKYMLQQELQENIQFQREDHLDACRVLGIENPRLPRLKSMPRGVTFKFWQPVAVKALLDFENSDWLRGALLCDDMGLGKTFEAIAYILRRHEIFLENQERGIDQPPEKPVLIVCPGILVKQWISELTRFLGVDISIWIYHGDPKNPDPGSHVRYFGQGRRGKLTRRHPVFTSSAVPLGLTFIITTPHTLNARHGPKAQAYTMRRDSYGKQHSLILRDEWEFNLSGCFGRIIVDEATMYRNPDNLTSIALHWLNTFVVALTATPFLNRQKDFTGLLKLIEPDPSIWRSEETMTRLDWPKDKDPYVFKPEEHHPDVRKLQVNANEYGSYVIQYSDKNYITAKEVARRTISVLAQCGIKRTYASRIPFSSGPSIGEHIPPVLARTLEVSFNVYEAKAYDRVYIPTVKRLAKYQDGQIIWNMGVFRKLVLITTWLGFEHVEQYMPAARTESLLRHRNTIKELLMICYRADAGFWEDPSADDPHLHLRLLCNGGPKIRALVKLISDVCIKQQKKLAVWCTFPAQIVIVTHTFRLLGIDAEGIHGGTSLPERTRIINDFQQSDTKCQGLVISYAVGKFGINLQFKCHHCCLLDSPGSLPIGNQCICRFRRTGQQRAVIVTSLYVQNSFQSRQQVLNIKKRIPGALTELNSRLVGGGNGDDEAGGAIKLGNWVAYEGKLTLLEDVPEDEEYEELTEKEFVELLLSESSGDVVVYDDPNQDRWGNDGDEEEEDEDDEEEEDEDDDEEEDEDDDEKEEDEDDDEEAEDGGESE
ncbi:MAG: hypothetical protein LQ341_006154, partial [Variospora aurantia]